MARSSGLAAGQLGKWTAGQRDSGGVTYQKNSLQREPHPTGGA